MTAPIAELTRRAAQASTLRLLIDYDGTLAEFAPTPDTVTPDEAVIALLERLVAAPGVLPGVISGRRLAHVRRLLPVRGLLLGGSYGVELVTPDGKRLDRLPFEQVRPTLERLLPRWQAVAAGHEGFYLEDKGWSLALHARLAAPEMAMQGMAAATAAAQEIEPGPAFRLAGDDQFLELAPAAANKAEAVKWVLAELTPPGALVLYLGDDDKDEVAFGPVLAAGGLAVRVGARPVETRAQYRLSGPDQVRAWLGELLEARGG